MKKYLSAFLSIVIFAFSQPVYAVPTEQNFDSEVKEASIEILSVDTKPITIKDLIDSENSMSNKTNSNAKLVQESELHEDNKSKNTIMKTNANGPDLVIGNLKTNPTAQPFSYTQDTKFQLSVANIGNSSISNVKIGVLIDGALALMNNFGTFKSNYGGTYSVAIKKLCGRHLIEFTIEGDSSEINTGNNKCSGNFTWKNVIDVAAKSPEQVGGTLVCTEPFEVKVPIANYGNIAATNVQVNFVLAGWDAGNITLDLPAQTGKIVTLTLTYNACGSGQFDVEVDKNKKINDADRSNNFITKQFYITPEEDETIGKYSDATNIKIAIAPSAHDLFDGSGKHIWFSDANKAMTAWNGVTNKTRVTVVANVLHEDPEEYSVVLISYSGGADDFIAATYRPDEWIDTSLRKMELNTYYFNGNDKEIGKKELVRTLTHETGHVFGLGHPQCKSKAIMQQSVYLKSGLASYSIELHDRANLKYLYS